MEGGGRNDGHKIISDNLKAMAAMAKLNPISATKGRKLQDKDKKYKIQACHKAELMKKH